MATFPGTITYTDQVDGTGADVTDINNPFNTSYTTINAIINGCEDLNNQVSALEAGVDIPGKYKLLVTWLTGTTIQITADDLDMVNAASGEHSIMVSDVDVTLNTAVVGAGGMDYAAGPNASTWHTLWVITQDNGAAPVALASLSTGDYEIPDNMPATYTYYRRVGWFKTDAAAAIIQFRHLADSQLWIWFPDNAEHGPVTHSLLGGAWVTYAFGAALPPIARRLLAIGYQVKVQNGAVTHVGHTHVRELGMGAVAFGYTHMISYAWILGGTGDSWTMANEFEVGCNTTQQVEAISDNVANITSDSLVLVVKGWYDPT